MDYNELVETLRNCTLTNCAKCDYVSECLSRQDTFIGLHGDAADAIEELLSFAHYVANKVTMSDEDWEDYHEAFTEVACRKLVKLGVISIEDDMYVYRQDKQRQEVQDGNK